MYSTPNVSPADRDWSAELTPGYNLATRQTMYDSTVGNITTTTNYGSAPEYGLAQSTTLDPTGLNYTSTATYETPGTAYLRQTSRSLPGGTTTNYAYYTATETRDNPCTPAVEAFRQAGRLKQKTEADPDGSGPQTSRVSETVYDTTGRTIASRYNNDAWTCTTYDTRGRVAQTVVPTINGRAGRTVSTAYSYQGSPFKTRIEDSVAGSSEEEIDLFGRKVSSKDTFNNTYTTTYDNLGRTTSQTSPLGTETYEYDNLNRQTSYKLDNVTYATTTYDAFSRVETVTYPEAKDGANNTLKLEQIKRDSLLRTNGAVFRFSDGTAFDETLSKTTSGLVASQTDVFGANSVTNTYQYDKSGRLTEAVIDTNKYTYGYGAPAGGTCTQPSANANAHKNSNRTNCTVTNTANNQVLNQQSYCYDKADRLLSSSDTQIGTPTYDDHGNTTAFSGGGTAISLAYDAADSNIAITQGNNKTEYVKSASGTVLRKKQYVNNTLTKSHRYLAGGSVLQTCANNDDNNCTTTDKYLNLPGGVLLTLTPANPNPAKQEVYSVKNFHGDTAMTASPDGAPTSSVFLYEPFGQQSQSATFGTGSNPQNSSSEPMGWAAHPSRKQESSFTLALVQMGARIYLPTLGRFAQVDPVEGGTLNSYVYAGDPVNSNDYSGRCVPGVKCVSQDYAYLQPAATITHIQNTATASINQTVYSPATRIRKAAPAKSSPRLRSTIASTSHHRVVASQSVIDFWKAGGPPKPKEFNWVGAVSTAMDYSVAGRATGATVGCGAGAIMVFEAPPVGCAVLGAAGNTVGGILFGIGGFIAGGFELGNPFEGADYTPTVFDK